MRFGLYRLAILTLALAATACEDNKKEGEGGPGGGVPPAADGGFPTVTGTTSGGLAITLLEATVAEGNKVQVTYRLAGPGGAPIPATGVTTSWTLAALERDPETDIPFYSSYRVTAATGAFGSTEQPASENNGTVEDLGEGRFRYTFANALPADFDRTATHRVGVYARKLQGAPDGGSDFSDSVMDFVPSGGEIQTHDVVSTAACNACHGVLQAHGGNRRDARLCTTCHTPQLFDPDTSDPAFHGLSGTAPMNPLDFATMTHRIHRGRDLPTLENAANATPPVTGLKYNVIGFRSTEFVFGEVTTADRDADKKPDRVGVAFPQDIRNCTTCHQGAPQADSWTRAASTRTCNSCHDATWLGDQNAVPPLHEAHPGGRWDTDASCQGCHGPEGEVFGASVRGAHTVPSKAEASNLMKLEIAEVQNGAKGANPTVRFRVLNEDGTPVTDLASLNRVALTLSGPTTNYSELSVVTQVITAATGGTADGNGFFTYTFVNRGTPPGAEPAIPANASGTWAMSIEARRPKTIQNFPQPVTFNEFGNNPVTYFSVDGSPVAPRRQVVATQNCNSCHETLSAHGDLRHEVEYCVMCHAPDATDDVQRPDPAAATADGLEARSIHFKDMIHRIHTGEELDETRPYLIYGFRSSLHYFDEVLYPQSRARCNACHVGDSFTIEAIPASAAPTTANETGSEAGPPPPFDLTIPPITASCVSCHDSSKPNPVLGKTPYEHAAQYITGTPPAEQCSTCHGESSGVLPVKAVHQRFVPVGDPQATQPVAP